VSKLSTFTSLLKGEAFFNILSRIVKSEKNETEYLGTQKFDRDYL
jgi:hypothetical protein